MWWDKRDKHIRYMKKNLIGKAILKVIGEGCQGMNSFQWLGKIVDIRQNPNQEKGWIDAIIEVQIHNHSYGDNRNNSTKEIYTYPIATKDSCIYDIQNINGVWVLFT